MPLSVGVERWPLAAPFAIARGVKTVATTLVVRISQAGPDGRPRVGLGEAVPYSRYGEDPEAAADAVAALRWLDDPALAPAARRYRLLQTLPAGAARNAADLALWDLEAKLSGRRVADLAQLSPPRAVETAFTISLDAPDAMGRAARAAAQAGRAALLKIKLGTGDAAEEAARLRAVRGAAPKARLIVDANEGWSVETLIALDPVCAEIGALFIEQPLPVAKNAALSGLTLATPLCADESCRTLEDLPPLQGVFQAINLKLDKSGGLTAALALRAAALENGFQLMIGCMVAGTLATAPAYLLTEEALAVDLDGPLLLAADRQPALRYEGSRLFAPEAAIWG